MREDVDTLLGRFIAGDVMVVEDLRSSPWMKILEAMQSFQGVIARDSAKRVLVASRDPNTRQAAWGWASFVRDGSLDPWVLEDGVLVSRATPERPGEVEFVLEPGFEDTILDVLHRIDDINIDGPIMDDEFDALLGSLC